MLFDLGVDVDIFVFFLFLVLVLVFWQPGVVRVKDGVVGVGRVDSTGGLLALLLYDFKLIGNLAKF